MHSILSEIILYVAFLNVIFILSVQSTGTGWISNPSFSDKELTLNLDHLKRELSAVVELEVDHISTEHLQFYYFRLHDSDKDGSLDGNELFSALTESAIRVDENGTFLTSDEFEKIYMEAVDSLIEEADEDKNGLVSYEEYILKARHFLKQD